MKRSPALSVAMAALFAIVLVMVYFGAYFALGTRRVSSDGRICRAFHHPWQVYFFLPAHLVEDLARDLTESNRTRVEK